MPGYKAGGPVRSLVNLVDRLGNEYDFSILTSDRDIGDRVPFSNILVGDWLTVGKARVMYLAPHQLRLLNWRWLLSQIQYDVLYLNSFFALLTIQTLVLRRLRQIPSKPVVLAPRGEFSSGALALKTIKKRAYIFLAKQLGLTRNVVWHASSDSEAQDIHRVFELAPIHTAENIVTFDTIPEKMDHRVKRVGELQIVFLSRIVRKKNLLFALQMLRLAPGCVKFDIYGPLEDVQYWQECQALIRKLPPSHRVNYCGVVAQDQVIHVFSKYHLFLFPTHGENFGHVVAEALIAGCPVLVSNQTPWRDLAAKHAGWDVSLSASEQFQAILNECVAMDSSTFAEWSRGARALGARFVESQNEQLDQFRSLINQLPQV